MSWDVGVDGPILIPVFGTPVEDELGLIYTPVVSYVPGYHLNVTDNLLLLHPSLEEYRIMPDTLNRVFSGDDPAAPEITIALRFTDEEEAKAVLAFAWLED